MVCEKNKDTVHDFEKDPIELVRNGNILMAKARRWCRQRRGRATNCHHVRQKLVHGPLEFLFTVDEETDSPGQSSQPGSWKAGFS